MEDENIDKENLMINKSDKKSKNNFYINSIKQKKEEENINLRNGQEDNYNLCYIAKRSYSCRINEPKNKNFVNKEEIKLNLNNKFMYLKTPQIKPKKSKLNPSPINLGSILYVNKKTRFNNANDIINNTISEGENEESNEYSYNSSSDFTSEEEIKDNQDNTYIEIIEDNENDTKEYEFIKKLKSENSKYKKDEDIKIEEENDDFDEHGNLSLKNIRKDMIQTKKKFSKNNKDIFNIIDENLIEKYKKKYKEDILMGNEEEEIGRNLHKTTGFCRPNNNNGLPILEFLKKNSSSALKLKNN